jgi:hypothetical protein
LLRQIKRTTHEGFVNGKEQICVEKLRSLMRIGAASTRFKDVFDVYYLLCREGVDENALDQAMHLLVYNASDMRENNSQDAYARLSRVLNSLEAAAGGDGGCFAVGIGGAGGCSLPEKCGGHGCFGIGVGAIHFD